MAMVLDACTHISTVDYQQWEILRLRQCSQKIPSAESPCIGPGGCSDRNVPSCRDHDAKYIICKIKHNISGSVGQDSRSYLATPGPGEGEGGGERLRSGRDRDR
jgi:hypothetical protein